MAELSPRPVQTFTIGFDHADLDERALARAVATRFATRHHEEVVHYPAFEESITRILYHTDEPFGDSSCLPTERVARYTSQHVKMALSGDGGDEVLSGYNAYQSERLAGYLAWAPAAAVQAVAAVIRVGGLPFGVRVRAETGHAAKIIRLSTVPFQRRLLEKAAWASVSVVRELMPDIDSPQIAVNDFLADFFRRCPWRDPFYQLMYFNLKSTLPDVMLTKVDRMSMANSLEVRAPFLDHRLIELMVAAHKNVKLPYFVRKAVLRRTLARTLPDCVIRARKRGFVAPFRHWLAAPDAAGLVNNFLRDCPLPLRRDVVSDVLAANARHEADYGNFIWMLMVLARWTKQHYPCAC
jgi:asparagine synthase (glutamine-hydrolysing)